jgi:hypothetical protein
MLYRKKWTEHLKYMNGRKGEHDKLSVSQGRQYKQLKNTVYKPSSIDNRKLLKL